MLGGENYRAGGQICKVRSFYQACVFMYTFVYTCTRSLGDVGQWLLFSGNVSLGTLGMVKIFRALLVAHIVKNLPAVQETQV